MTGFEPWSYGVNCATATLLVPGQVDFLKPSTFFR